jgi:hypothetical protein
LLNDLELASQLTREEMLELLDALNCGTGREFLDRKSGNLRGGSKTREQKALSSIVSVLRNSNARVAFGSVAFRTEEPLALNVELAKEVLCALAHAWGDSKLREPLGADKARPSTVRRFSSLCSASISGEMLVGKSFAVNEIETVNLGEREMRSIANYCGKGLCFLNREVWRRQGDFVAAVLFVGENGLDMRKNVFCDRAYTVKKALEAGWEAENEMYRPTHRRSCFVVVTQGSEKAQVNFVKQTLETVFDLEIVRGEQEKRLNLRGKVLSSWVQPESNLTCMNPALDAELHKASKDIELLCLAELGLDWSRESEQLRFVGEPSPSCVGWTCR